MSREPRAVSRINQARVFRRLRWLQAWNGLAVIWRTNRVRFLSILGTSGFVALFVFALSWFGFRELEENRVPFKGLIVSGLFDVLFLTMGMMLVVSTGVILYASLFTSPEAKYLLTTPATADRIFAVKFSGAVGFSSWGFVMLSLPILAAYGIVAGVPWWFYALLPWFLVGYVLLPAAVSSVVCLLLMRFMPRNRKQFLIMCGVVLLAAAGWRLYRTGLTARDALQASGRDALQGFVDRFAVASHPLNPSHWLTNGMLAAARGEVNDALRPLALLWSNGLLIYLLAAFTAGRVYRTAYDRAGGGRKRQAYRGRLIDTAMEKLVWYLDRPTRVLVVKDFRTFRRDPSQWALIAIFAIMLAIGAGNFNSYYTADLDTIDKYIVGLVNLGGTAILLCAALSRFVFPLISLEGRKFWILGLMPIQRQSILTGKFAFAATGAVIVGVMLVVGSEVLLGLSRDGLAIHALTIVCIALGLAGLNVGLGAAMPNFRETDPSKIVVGFSGTVNMVLGLMFVVATLAAMAGPMHAAAVMKHFAKNTSPGFPPWAWAGLPLGLLFTGLAVWLPLRAGRRALEQTEF